MRNKEEIEDEKSSLLSKAIFVWFFAILIEFVIFEILMRNRQYLSPLPIIKDNTARWIILGASIVVYLITTIYIIDRYIKKKAKIDRDNKN